MRSTVGQCLDSWMAAPGADARGLVEKYFRERKEELQEMHDAFGVEPPPAMESKSKLQPWEKSRYDGEIVLLRRSTRLTPCASQ